uniref:Uncharacterized protein n=1 Tax=Arundo donax TaxID=35708 RepID=A0A0A9ABZ2_ARUDO
MAAGNRCGVKRASAPAPVKSRSRPRPMPRTPWLIQWRIVCGSNGCAPLPRGCRRGEGGSDAAVRMLAVAVGAASVERARAAGADG